MTPMFSEYVVVAGPPNAVDRMLPAPSAEMAVPSLSSSGSPVISPTALTCPAFSATSAMTTGSATRIADHEKSGPCTDGKPNQSALATPDRSSRQWSVTLPLASWEWIFPKTVSKPHDMR